MTGWTKIGNRYYKLEDGTVKKAVLRDEEYDICGEWAEADFVAHETEFDGNTEDEYDQIKANLGL